ncbi:hypothetical protein P5V15_012916 [Pogonomyrmex californicus]
MKEEYRSGKLQWPLEIGCAKGAQTSYTPFENSRVQVDKNAPEIRPVTVNLDKHSRVPTVQVEIRNITDDVTLMPDTSSRPNIIKENLIPEDEKINYTNILKLNGINNYPGYTLGKITLILFNKPITFHIVANNFPIPQSGILGNDFFKQT